MPLLRRRPRPRPSIQPATDAVEVRKKLIEVALPLHAINREAARERAVRNGHPSSMHRWWDRTAVAVSRAVLFASVIDDPGSRPDRFPDEASQAAERDRLLEILERLLAWEAAGDAAVLDEARRELRAAANPLPAVVDPFAGDGSVALEARRLGFAVLASDTDPVSVLATRALVEIPSRFPMTPSVHGSDADAPGSPSLAAVVRRWGTWMQREARQRIGDLYATTETPAGDVVHISAWLWARTVACSNPDCRAQVPLARSFVLSSKGGRRARVAPIVDRSKGTVAFETRRAGKPTAPTVDRRGARCLVCDHRMPFAYLREESLAGRLGRTMLAIVAEHNGSKIFLAPDAHQVEFARRDEPRDAADAVPADWGLGPQVRDYGFTRLTDLHTERQLVALTTYADLVLEARDQARAEAAAAGHGSGGSPSADAYGDAVATYLALAVVRLADVCNTLCAWDRSRTRVSPVLTRHGIPMVWDFAESNVFTGGTDFSDCLENIVRAIPSFPYAGSAEVVRREPSEMLLPSPAIVSTRPSDGASPAGTGFVSHWLERCLRSVDPPAVTPVGATEGYELLPEEAYGRMREAQDDAFPLTVISTVELPDDEDDGRVRLGWETALEGLLTAGLSVTRTWPLRGDRGHRGRGRAEDSPRSIVLVCRPRAIAGALATRKGFLTALRSELREALHELRGQGIAPVDLAPAAIGAGVAVFARYGKVVEEDGSAMGVREALQLIDASLNDVLAQHDAAFDDRTRWALSWFSRYGMGDGPHDEAQTLCEEMGVSLDGLVESGLVVAAADRVRLLRRDELASPPVPSANGSLTTWELVQRLAGRLEKADEAGAAEVLEGAAALEGAAKALAYRLHAASKSGGWSEESRAYDALVAGWPRTAREVAEA